MNEINSSKRYVAPRVIIKNPAVEMYCRGLTLSLSLACCMYSLKYAVAERAEGDKILLVKSAEAEAEAK